MSLIRKIFPGKRPTVAGVFLVSVGLGILLNFLPGTSGFAALFSFIAVVTGLILIFRWLPWVVRKSIWRLRNRLLVNYLFIAVVPIVLILLLVGIGLYMIAGQTGSYLVGSELQRTMSSLLIPSRVLASNPVAAHPFILNQVSGFIKQRFPDAEIAERIGDHINHFPSTSTLEPLPASVPEYTGVVVRKKHYFGMSHVKQGEMVVDVLAPLDSDILAQLVPKIGAVDLVSTDPNKAQLDRRKKRLVLDDSGQPLGVLPPAANRFDIEVFWGTPLKIADWDRNLNTEEHLHYLVLRTRPSALLSTVFGGASDQTYVLSYVFATVAVMFLLVELAALIIGVRLTRTITGAMEDLYHGTQRVSAGDFSHRIPVKGSDQIAEVSKSFNGMTTRIEELIVVAKEKERLQSELAIACEVQAQLFPRSSPVSSSLEVLGVCRPARMVSGDYYDYLSLNDNHLAMAVGDVAGKGISAALLMASIQSIMRTQLSTGRPAMAAAANGRPRQCYSTSQMVAQLNRQLYESTSPEKYATFLFGVYDEYEHALKYTNAGHLPPILLRRGQAELLEVTGTVVGAFPHSVYEEETIHFEPGDLLISYTDGVTEPENAYGEEFGTERLIDAITEHRALGPELMMERVMDAVRQWTVAPELPDDMTLVMARRIG